MNPNTDFIPFSRPSIGPAEEEAVLRVLRSGWLTTAGETLAFEREFASAMHKRHAVALNSATAGLHLALESVGVGPGDLVAMSPYTFASTAEVVRYLGAHPLFVDIEEEGYNLDPEKLEAALAHRPAPSEAAAGPVRAVMPVHVAGEPCRMEEIGRLAAQRELSVIADSAHTLRTAEGVPVGTEGDAAVFSFYATKPITTGEGGMVVTDRDDMAERMRLMRLHGIDRDVWGRYTSPGAGWAYSVVEAGFKYNMTDLAAAIGRVQLSRDRELHRRRREIATYYRNALGELPYLRMPREHPLHCYHLFIVEIDEAHLSIGRDEFIEELREAGIGASVHFIPLHVMPYYRNLYGFTEHDFPVSWNRFLRSLSLPLYPGLRDSEVQRVVDAVRGIGDRRYRRRTTSADGG